MGLVTLLDTLIALMAGVVIFSIVFSFNLKASSGPSLIFSTLPTLFAQIPGGSILAVLFFVLLVFAALTSAIALLEVVVAYFVDTYAYSRKKVTIISGIITFSVGLLTAFSYNSLSGIKLPVKFLFGSNLVFFDTFDKLASNILLPLGGLFIAIFTGWKLKKSTLYAEFTKKEQRILPTVIFILRYLAPTLVAMVFLYGLAITHPIFKIFGIK